MSHRRTVVLGAGPAGLTAAYELTRHQVPVTVLERDPRYVGGIARTVEHRGYRFDIGGHRFFSKNQEIEELWTELLGDQMLTCGRLSRIHYGGRYFDYPLRAANALVNLGPRETVRCVASYAKARIRPPRNARTVEDWVVGQFGRRLFELFFKTYTEKVWGMRTDEISADWAAQRIKGLDLVKVIKSAVLPRRRPASRGEVIKTLIDEFRYPRLGPGQMWDRVAALLAGSGQPVRLGAEVLGLRHRQGRVVSAIVRDRNGARADIDGSDFVSSLPIKELIARLQPAAPEAVRRAAGGLKYRDFLTIALMIDAENLFPDNWIYIHDPGVKVGRVQNFKNWSGAMVPDQTKTCLGLEYFCFEGDGLWSMSDPDLLRLGAAEIEQVGICARRAVFDGCVVRQAKAYPVYDDGYEARIEVIRRYLERSLANLHLVGRNGMHKYNNQDHSMLTAMAVVDGLARGHVDKNAVWSINTEQEYHEEKK
ncbi:MAG: NAD(P)/FAD-dependent oxidoreductase [Candidatus Dormibacteraceae bacterium]